MNTTRYREAEARLWQHYCLEPTERRVPLPSLASHVRVQDVGEGEPLLFVHGGPNAGSTFAPLVATVRPRRCLILDRPGCGLSGPIDYAAHPMPALAVEVLAATLDALGIERIDVVASSLGGAWALWFALARPERVRRLVLLGAPALVPDMLVPGFMRMLLTPLIGSAIAYLPPSVGGSQWTHQQMGHSPDVVRSVIPRVYWDWAVRLMADTSTMASDVRGIHSVATRGGVRPEIAFTPEQLRAVRVPALLYWGGADTFGGAGLARATADLLPDSTLEVVPGAGHLPWLDDPAHTARSITAFLADAEARLTLAGSAQ